ncbi:hypothetical protein AKJ65_03260 [candidate division MSBL1 archaeon SCGC-AAA259E19]|uniref:Uncharacterized protein n=1 Tax=candidate division MSBL1 archaeon SCGC-AAA259E19 TaxID=1698264 RepID=A0A133UKV8_9EURY|nr:hypothetical protein AKJ65_03260 [candidate division MSBL1 archaeon SCGC-AAA259E19]
MRFLFFYLPTPPRVGGIGAVNPSCSAPAAGGNCPNVRVAKSVRGEGRTGLEHTSYLQAEEARICLAREKRAPKNSWPDQQERAVILIVIE